MRVPSLFSQLFILLLVMIGSGQLLTWWLLHHEREAVLASQVREQSLDYLADMEDRLAELEPGQRLAWLQWSNRPYSLSLHDQPPAAPSEQPSPLARKIIRELNTALGGTPEYRYQTQPKERLWLKTTVLNSRYWLEIPLQRFRPPPKAPLALGLTIFVLMAALTALVFVWRINRPIRQLTLAAQALGQGQPLPALPHAGAREIRLLTAAFGRMAEDIRQHTAERELWLAGVSHDLKTPLTRLKLALALLPDDADHRAMGGDIDDLERIIRQFLDYVRGTGDETPEAVPLNAWLTRLTLHFPELVIRHAPNDTVRLQPLALERVLFNLLENARRYAPGRVELCARLQAGQLQLELRDFGPGIPPEKLADWLAPFRRGNQARTADGGTGLGLTIVDRLVQDMQGQWRIVNAEGGGLQITITLPAV